MPKAALGKQEQTIIENYLKTYMLNKKLLGIEKYHKEYFSHSGEFLQSTDEPILNESPLARSRMFKVRHFILNLPNSDEKLFLYYHYIKGEPTEKCADLLGVSRRSAFRIRIRALKLAYDKLSINPNERP